MYTGYNEAFKVTLEFPDLDAATERLRNLRGTWIVKNSTGGVVALYHNGTKYIPAYKRQ